MYFENTPNFIWTENKRLDESAHAAIGMNLRA